MLISFNAFTSDLRRIEVVFDSKGDTILLMPLEAAKTLLIGVMEGEVCDSLLNEYIRKDNIQKEIILLKLSTIRNLNEKSNNYEILTSNLNKMLKNASVENGYLNETIKDLKKQVRKERRQKRIIITVGFILPITIFILSVL